MGFNILLGGHFPGVSVAAAAAVSNTLSFVSGTGVSCHLPAPMILQHANSLALRYGKISDLHSS